MKKLPLIIKREFLARVRNRSFIVMTFLSPIFALGMGMLVFFLTQQNDSNIKEIVFVDESGLFIENDFTSSENVKFLDYTKLGLLKTKEAVEKGNHYGVLHIPENENLEVLANSIQFFSKETPGFIIIEKLQSNINKKLTNLKMLENQIDVEKIKASKISADLKLMNFEGEKSSSFASGAKIVIGSIAGYLLMMFVIIYGNAVMRSIIEEKTSRIIEVIISSVKPFELMLGKIIGNASAGLLQFSIWGILLIIGGVVLSLLLGLETSSMISDNIDASQLEEMQKTFGDKAELIVEIQRFPWVKMFFLFLFYFLGGYVLYSSLFAAVGAAVDSETDTQQFVMPIMMPLMLAVYVGAFSVINDPHGPVSVFFSHFPLTSSIVMLMRIPFGVAWWEILLSMFTLILAFVFVVWLASKIYRVGILMYGKRPTYKDLWKWINYNG